MKTLFATLAAAGLAMAVPSISSAQTVTYYPSTGQSYYSQSYSVDPATGVTVAYPSTVYSYGSYYPNWGYYGPRYYNYSPYYRPYYRGYSYYRPYYNGYSYYRPWRWR